MTIITFVLVLAHLFRRQKSIFANANHRSQPSLAGTLWRMPRKRGRPKTPGTLCVVCNAQKRAKARTVCNVCRSSRATVATEARGLLLEEAASKEAADRVAAAAMAKKIAADAAKAAHIREADALNAAGKLRVTRAALSSKGAVPSAEATQEPSAELKEGGGRELYYDDALKAAGKPQSRVADVQRRGFVAGALRGSPPKTFGLGSATSACLLTLISVGVGLDMSAYAADTYALQGKQRQASSSTKTAKRIHFGTPKRYNKTVLLPKYTLCVSKEEKVEDSPYRWLTYCTNTCTSM